MNCFKDSINLFKSQKSEDQIKNIESCIESFTAYVEEKFKYIHNGPSWTKMGESFTTDDYELALKKFIEDSKGNNRPIQFRSRVDSYRSFFSEYIRFLDESRIKFSILNNLASSSDYSIGSITKRIIGECGLEKEKPLQVLPKDKIKPLIELCDKKMQNVSVDKLLSDSPGVIKNKGYNDYLRYLIIKYMILFGLKCESIGQILYTSELGSGKIELGSRIVDLPPSLKEQTKIYLDARTAILSSKGYPIVGSPMFVLRNGELENSMEGRQGEAICNHQFYVRLIGGLLKELHMRCSSIAFITYRAIMNMIEIAIPQSIILSTTGYDIPAYNKCVEYLQEEGTVIPFDDYLNEKIKDLDFYDDM